MMRHSWQRRALVWAIVGLFFYVLVGWDQGFVATALWLGRFLAVIGASGAIMAAAVYVLIKTLDWIDDAPGDPEPPMTRPHDVHRCSIRACDQCDRIADLLAKREMGIDQ